MPTFHVDHSDLARFARNNKTPNKRYLAAIDAVPALFPEDAHITYTGHATTEKREATYVPYGSTSAMLHDAYWEATSVDIESINHHLDDTARQSLDLDTLPKQHLTALEDLLANYLTKQMERHDFDIFED